MKEKKNFCTECGSKLEDGVCPNHCDEKKEEIIKVKEEVKPTEVVNNTNTSYVWSDNEKYFLIGYIVSCALIILGAFVQAVGNIFGFLGLLFYIAPTIIISIARFKYKQNKTFKVLFIINLILLILAIIFLIITIILAVIACNSCIEGLSSLGIIKLF